MKTIQASGGMPAKDEAAFRIVEQEKPSPGARDIVVRVVAIGMNPVDTKVRQRMEGNKVLGWDAVGTVEAVGSEVRDFVPGDRVFYAGDITRPGCNSEYHLVDERIAAHAPVSLSAADAVAMPLTSITAWEALFLRIG
ncbi:alcohol dehydrogenase catalytic domain-containing protein, partial [Desulfobaculum sp.]